MVCSRPVNENPGSAFNILLLSKFVLDCAIFALSLVSNDFFPVNKDRNFSNRHARDASKGVAFLCGLFFPKLSAIVSSNLR